MKVTCRACNGVGKKKIGGIEADCRACKGKKYKIVEDAPEASQAVEKEEQPKRRAAPKKTKPKAEEAKVEAKPKPETAIEVPVVTLPHVIETSEPTEKQIFPPYSNETMRALFEEKSMSYPKWKEKHKHNPELFNIVKVELGFNQPPKEEVIELYNVHDRLGILESYAMSKPIAPRRANSMSAQDAAYTAAHGKK